MAFIKRDIESYLVDVSKYYPVLTLTGPRQSGKTTLVRKLFDNKPYYNLEYPDVLQNISEDPRRFLRRNPDGVILDEIQNYPEICSYIMAYVDEQKKKSMFVLTGSQNFAISNTVSQSLAGRTSVNCLLPLSVDELVKSNLNQDVDDFILNGFYPGKYMEKIDPHIFYRNYIKTYVERDIQSLKNVKNLKLFQKFLKICASRVGQIFKADSIANEVGISYHTVQEWLSLLAASYIVYLLPPYYKNFGKRIIKSPKLYFYDTGLACYLLNIFTEEQMSRDPLRGVLFENMVVMEIVKNFEHMGVSPNIYFYRDHNGNEVDVVFDNADKIVPVEIKSSETFNQDFLTSVKYLNKISDQDEDNGFVVYAGENVTDSVINFRQIKSLFL